MRQETSKAADRASSLRGEHSPVARRSALIHRFMVSTFRRYFTRHMNALRIAAWGTPAEPQQGPLIVYSNHPAWWDAAVYILANLLADIGATLLQPRLRTGS